MSSELFLGLKNSRRDYTELLEATVENRSYFFQQHTSVKEEFQLMCTLKINKEIDYKSNLIYKFKY